MVIYLGADHRGFKLKQFIAEFLKGKGYEVADMGNSEYDEGDDYVDFARKVAEKVSLTPSDRGILVCGSGAGMDIAANKFRKVRATVGISADQVFDARHDDDINVLSISANSASEAQAQEMVKVFLETPFSGEERHARRLEKVLQIEQKW